jgi:hypothetical protein
LSGMGISSIQNGLDIFLGEVWFTGQHGVLLMGCQSEFESIKHLRRLQLSIPTVIRRRSML